MDFSRIPRSSLLGRALRAPLSVIPKNAVVPIPQGPLRGQRWVVGAATHGCWLGTYEYRKQRLFARSIRPGAIVYDVGANVGFYTLLAAVMAGASGRVYRGVGHFPGRGESHDGSPRAWWWPAGGNCDPGRAGVRARLAAAEVIKVDIEGGGLRALQGARRLLEARHPMIFLSMHGQVVHEQCPALLTELGYGITGADEEEATNKDELLARFYAVG